MDKENQFITEVQTGIIIHFIKKRNNRTKTIWSALGFMDDAFRAGKLIPKNKTAHKAACEFLEFIFEDHEEPGYKPPNWLTRAE